ncbi:MAG: glucose-1-phosphate adenylyltransferase subunit GlgD [Oscillospiraceae bacterium]|nr:glucose-1-phosphate adenylyltransferase subunit GlgD [Oscillospiraceae bacterium]
MKGLHGILFAYSEPRLKELTEHRTASSLPFGGRYRVIDFMLSSLVNAGVTDVGVIVRENYQSLLDHLESGRNWDLSRKRGGLRFLPPFGYTKSIGDDHREGVPRAKLDPAAYRGILDALYGISDYISHIRQDHVILADGDIIANLPLEEIFENHLETGADLTCVCTPLRYDRDERAYFKLGKNGIVNEVLLNRPGKNSVADLGVYIMSKNRLQNILSHCDQYGYYHFARDVLRNMYQRIRVAGYLYDGFATRIQSVEDYFKQSMLLLNPEVRNDLFSKERPIKTKVRDEPSSYYGQGSKVRNCVLADGCFLEGDVKNCVIFRGVRVESEAVVRDCILMQDTHVRQGARINHIITDKEVIINPRTSMSGHKSYPVAIAKGSIV